MMAHKGSHEPPNEEKRKMAAAKTTKAPAVTAPPAPGSEPEVDGGSDIPSGALTPTPATDKPKADRKRTPSRMLMEVVETLPEETSTRGGGVAFVEAFAKIKEMTENDEIPWNEADDKPSWVAVKEYGNASGARNHIKEMEGTGKGKKSTGPKTYAAGFEFTDRKFTAADGAKTSILYARYVGA